MKEQTKLSRREAIKILGAATGASLLANIPAKWSKPELTGSNLPAFAQTSCLPVRADIILATTHITGSIIDGPLETFTNWNGFVPTYALWDCQDDCLQLAFSLNNPALTGTVRITTNWGQVDLVMNNSNPADGILIYLGTGEFDVTGTGNPGGCSWPAG